MFAPGKPFHPFLAGKGTDHPGHTQARVVIKFICFKYLRDKIVVGYEGVNKAVAFVSTFNLVQHLWERLITYTYIETL